MMAVLGIAVLPREKCRGIYLLGSTSLASLLPVPGQFFAKSTVTQADMNFNHMLDEVFYALCFIFLDSFFCKMTKVL